MEEQETTQGEAETSTEEGITQPTVEELQKERDNWKLEAERKEGVIQTTKREIKELRQRGGSKAEIDALGNKLEDYQKFMAGALDEIYNRSSGEYEDKPVRKTYSQQLEERQAKPEPTKEDPDARKFLNYCEAMDLHVGADIEDCDPLVQEAMKDRDLRDGLKYLKEKMKPQETDVDKLVDEKLTTRLQQEREKWAKDMGLTSEGAGAPSGSSVGFEKAEQDYADGKISTSEYKKLRQEQGIQ